MKKIAEKRKISTNDELKELEGDFPELIDFMKRIAVEKSPDGLETIRCSVLYRGKQIQNDFRWEILLMYKGNYKFCERIQRHHKNNNIYFVVDMRRGTYRQKCHDVDCRNFQGEEKILPSNVTPWLFIFDDDWNKN